MGTFTQLCDVSYYTGIAYYELVITPPVRQGWIRKDEEGKTKDKTYPINETNLRALRSGYQAEHAPPLRLARGFHSSPPP